MWLNRFFFCDANTPQVLPSGPPSLPVGTAVFVEARYDSFETKHRIVLRPRGEGESDPSAGAQVRW